LEVKMDLNDLIIIIDIFAAAAMIITVCWGISQEVKRLRKKIEEYMEKAGIRSET